VDSGTCRLLLLLLHAVALYADIFTISGWAAGLVVVSHNAKRRKKAGFDLSGSGNRVID